jgi:hypothetical protein
MSRQLLPSTSFFQSHIFASNPRHSLWETYSRDGINGPRINAVRHTYFEGPLWRMPNNPQMNSKNCIGLRAGQMVPVLNFALRSTLLVRKNISINSYGLLGLIGSHRLADWFKVEYVVDNFLVEGIRWIYALSDSRQYECERCEW